MTKKEIKNILSFSFVREIKEAKKRIKILKKWRKEYGK